MRPRTRALVVSVLLLSTIFAPTPALAQEIVWIDQFGDPNWPDDAVAIAADETGIYVTGSTAGSLAYKLGFYFDGYIRKYDTLGKAVWTRQFGTNGNEKPTSISLSRNGRVHVAGITYPSLDSPPEVHKTNVDIGVWTFDNTNGFPLGSSSIVEIGYDHAWGVAAARDSDAVYVVGSTTASPGADAGPMDGLLIQYTAPGAQDWLVQFGNNADEEATAVATYGSHVYVVGWTSGDFHGTNVGYRDAFISRYDAAGNGVGGHQYGTSESDIPEALTIDPNGNVYVLLSVTSSLGITRWFIVRYDQYMKLVWTREIYPAKDAVLTALTSDYQGNVYVAGAERPWNTRAFIQRYRPDGGLVWTAPIDTDGDHEEATGIANVGRDLYVSGKLYDGNHAQAFAARLQQPSCWTTSNPTGDERDGILSDLLHDLGEPAVGPLGIGDDLHNINCSTVRPQGL